MLIREAMDPHMKTAACDGNTDGIQEPPKQGIISTRKSLCARNRKLIIDAYGYENSHT